MDVDFAVWVPHNNRLMKKRAMEGWRPGPNGTFQPIQLFGPPSPDEWRKCYKLFRTNALMKGIIDYEWLDRYVDIVVDLADEAPKAAWPLIYQVEARTRSEYILRLRRRLEDQHELCIERNWPTEFDPERPWNAVWKALCTTESSWWREQVKDPCMLIKTDVEKPRERVEEDHPARGDPRHHHPHVPRRAASSPSPPALHAAPRPNKRKTENSKGTELCKGFNEGTCTAMKGSRCAKNATLAHQCSICLDNRHGAWECPQGEPKKAKKTKSRGAGKRKRAAGKQ